MRAPSPNRIHPDLVRVARVLPRGAGRPMLAFLSRRVAWLMDRRPLPGAGERVDDGVVAMRLHRPAQAAPGPLPALLWMHGGGFVLGHPSQDDATCQRFANELGIVVAAVRYRLAPDHPFPAAVEDCHAALVALAARDEVDASNVAIGGASAGGGLTVQLALMARQRDEVQPTFQLLVYPMLDDRTALRTDIDERGFRLWNTRSNDFGWRSYLGMAPGSSDVPPEAAPARHTDLRGLPPAWLGVGTQDLFYDEDVAFAAALERAGVPCELVVVEGAFHGFEQVAPQTAVARSFSAAKVAALARAIHGERPDDASRAPPRSQAGRRR